MALLQLQVRLLRGALEFLGKEITEALDTLTARYLRAVAVAVLALSVALRLLMFAVTEA